MNTALQITSLVLSLTALLVTCAGFFASLMFYREGKDLNTKAQDALARIDEKATVINEQIGKRFEMTLSSVLSGPAGEGGEVSMTSATSEQESNAASGRADGGSSPSDGEVLDKSILRYFNLRDMRLSDISNSDTRSIYNLGKANGFNLFDGGGKLVFFGPFKNTSDEDIVLNLRGLLRNIDLAYQSINENSSGETRQKALNEMDMIKVEILLGENSDVRYVKSKCEELVNEIRSVPVRVITSSQFEEELDEMKKEVVS